jgi:hypothetical protein
MSVFESVGVLGGQVYARFQWDSEKNSSLLERYNSEKANSHIELEVF